MVTLKREKKILIGVLVVLIALLGYLLLRKTPEVAEGNFVLGASFTCTDGHHFIAEFSSEESIKISEDENVITVPRAEGPGKKFENSTSIFIFAGEGATVTDKRNKTTVTCTQPFDPGHAPVNFGDAGEGAGETQHIVLAVNENILGKWQSTQDAKFVRVFKEGFVVEDSHRAAVTTGTWKTFTKQKPITQGLTLEDDAVYVQIVIGKETMNFKVGKLTPENLVLAPLNNGENLIFVKMK